MLRASSEITGAEVDLQVVVDGNSTDSGVPGGALLIEFVEAALADQTKLTAARNELQTVLGTDALVDAAGVIGNFQRMVRIADCTGIPLDARSVASSASMRETLGLNDFDSARLPDNR
jgi:hypothetical protein